MKKVMKMMAVLPMMTMGLLAAQELDAQNLKCKTQVIAHRCYHENGVKDKQFPENSLAAFKRAQTLGIYGAEIDVWITPDDVVVVNHNSTIPTDEKQRKLEFTDYAEIKDVTLANGEPVPTLESLLQAMKDSSSDMKLILELKSHKKATNNNRVVDKCVEMVKAYGLEEQVIWIAFSWDNCCRVAQALPDAMVMYLNGDKTPKVCKENGIRGIDYSRDKTYKKYVRQAHRLGMAVNVWTVNTEKDMNEFLDRKCDFITTNHPDVLKELIAERNK